MKKTRRQRTKQLSYIVIAGVLLGSYTAWALLRSLPLIQPRINSSQITRDAPPAHLMWPTSGQAAVGILGNDKFNMVHGAQTPSPTASTAKIITALVVLHQKPLTFGQVGPTLTMTPNDVELFKNYASQDGSLVPIVEGEQITEYQMLQAMMLPSANNIADTMAIWAFGSLSDYAAVANAYLVTHGLSSTHVGEDASGFSPTTTSTAGDLLKLGKLAMEQPVLAEVVGQPSAQGVPPASTIKNVNSLLGGMTNIVGIKTGNTDQAGGVFVSASRIPINGKPVTIVTSVVGSPTLFSALKDSLALIKSAQADFTPLKLVAKGTVVGRYKIPWGNDLLAVTSRDLRLTVPNGTTGTALIALNSIPPKTTIRQPVGSVSVGQSALSDKKTVAVTLSDSVGKPSIWWKLTHPL